jgi:hypothetical protein
MKLILGEKILPLNINMETENTTLLLQRAAEL